MLIADRFAWAHLGKTGGNATVEMLWRVPGLVRYADSPASPATHATFAERADLVGDRLRVANIRRLPHLLLSYHHWIAVHGVYPDPTPVPVPPLDDLASSSAADQLLDGFTAGGTVGPQRWLRNEHLADDLLELVAEHQPLDQHTIDRVRSVGRINPLDRPPTTLTSDQLAAMYGANPEWAAIEATVYGSLVTAGP